MRTDQLARVYDGGVVIRELQKSAYSFRSSQMFVLVVKFADRW